MKTFKAFVKPFEALKKKCENKNLSQFSLFIRNGDGKGQARHAAEIIFDLKRYYVFICMALFVKYFKVTAFLN